MTETGRSASAARGGGAGPPPQVLRTIAAQVVAVASVGCVLWALVGVVPWPALGAILGFGLGGLWQAHRSRDRWPEQRAVDRALREHVDPGPVYRAATDRAARVQLARRTAELAIGVVIVIGLTLACLVVAVIRRDVTVALSAIPLAGASVSGVLWLRRRNARAARWLAHPPFPREEE
jgi:hypothetical protein